MTPDVEKLVDMDCIFWNEITWVLSMAQISHIAEIQCMEDMLFLHSVEQW